MIKNRCQKPWYLRILTIYVFPIFLCMEASAAELPSDQRQKEKRFRFPSPREFFQSIRNGDNLLYETLFRPLEFREPIVTIPAEGRYGVGFYGWKGLNPFRFDSSLISYETETEDFIEEIGLSGRTGSFVEIETMQTNLSYFLFKKSYIDFLTGLGFRYTSIFPFPTIQLTDKYTITGPPDVPVSWAADTALVADRKFAPSILEGNLVSSFIIQWSRKWFVHFKYSYGLNRTRFYKGAGMDRNPYGTGTSSAYSVGIKFIRESDSAARYAWGFELRHMYHKVRTIHDPDDLTPVTRFSVPSIGIFFTFSAFYGGHTTVGDEGKRLFMKRDYVSAKPKLSQFTESYPNHARIRRARKLLELCNKRIPYQLYSQGIQMEKRGELDTALEKLVQARLTADKDLVKSVIWEIDDIADQYIATANEMLGEGNYEDALRTARKAAAASEKGRRSQRLLEGRVYLSQGKDLAFVRLYPMALKKYSEAVRLAPELKEEVRRAELEAAVGLLEDVNQASDESSLRLALRSLYVAREILGKSDDEMESVISQLEGQLSHLDRLRLRIKMDEHMNQARGKLAQRYAPRVELGMLVAEAEDILGNPHEVVERVDDNGRNYQMWIYRLPDKEDTLLYFEDYVLFKIEVE